MINDFNFIKFNFEYNKTRQKKKTKKQISL